MDLNAEVARLRYALKREERLNDWYVIHRDYQPSSFADLVRCLNIWLGPENRRVRQDFEAANPHGGFAVANCHTRPAEEIKDRIGRLIEVGCEALGETAKSTV